MVAMVEEAIRVRDRVREQSKLSELSDVKAETPGTFWCPRTVTSHTSRNKPKCPVGANVRHK